MAGLYPLSRMQQFDGRGKPLSGARLFLFDGGTTTPRIGYKDSSLTSEHPNPIIADSSGRLPLIYLDDGFYRHRLTTKSGTLIFDDDGLPVLSATEGGSGTSVDPDSVYKTRDIKIRFDDQPLAGYVRLNGRTIGSAGSGATERANADTQSLYEELWSFANIAVSGGKGGSAAADFAANKPLVLPDMAGRLLAGMDDLGAGAASRITTTYLGADPTAPGAVGGAQTTTLTNSQMPVSSPWSATATVTVSGIADLQGNHAHFGTTDSGGPSNHTHNWLAPSSRTVNISNGGGGATNNLWQGATGEATNAENSSLNHTHGFNTSTTGAHTHNVTASGNPVVTMQSNIGGGQPTNKLNPLMTFMIYIRL